LSFWTKEKILMYVDACETLNYPDIPLGPYFKKVIHAEDTVMDIGCGPGVVSLYLASLCQSVTAVDPDEDAISYLKQIAAKRGIANLNIVRSKWPEPSLAPCDVTVIAYVFHALNDLEKIKELLRITKRTGIILEPVTKLGFHEPLYHHLGIKMKKPNHNSNSSKTIEMLQSLGVSVAVEEIAHDFGQPVDTYDEAAAFLWGKLHIGEEHYEKVRDCIEDYTESRQGRLYVPNHRINRLITFQTGAWH
jgi:SAM-dependent methyltransferase